MISKKDYNIGALVGALVGILAIPTLYNIGVRSPYLFLSLPFVLAAFFSFGVRLGGFLSRWLPFFAQFGKFAAVGFLSTAIDFGTLNVLSLASGITRGFVVGGINVPGFGAAVMNGYLWNKLWVFGKREGALFADFPLFFAVALVGLFLNTGIVVFLTTYVNPVGGFSAQSWLNISKVAANAIVLIWNFLGFKFIVFRR